jgi:putative transposase
MAFDPDKHHRRSIRLKEYDYALAGAYFITLCTQGRLCLFGEVVDAVMQLNDAGRIIQIAWEELPKYYAGVETDAFVVMPNHIHCIIVLVGAGPRACPVDGRIQGPAPTISSAPGNTGRVRRPAHTAMSLSDVIHRFKTITTKRYADGVKQYGWPPFPGRLWQRNYYEHIIRNEESLDHIRQYIADNPMRWAIDRENPLATELEPEDAWRI